MKLEEKTLTIQFLKDSNKVCFREITEIIKISEEGFKEKSNLLREFDIPSEYKQSILYLEELIKTFEIFSFYKFSEEYEVLYIEEENIYGDIIQIYKSMFDREDLIMRTK
ncbi:hypothetical protein [Fusobacterium ulcerans]|uniref:hypothetical protein n=1 Tax=Fusobacterium ulcerans TaxID=861 RepID=UPI00102F678B|nr:hypothetical protein [Fusobacterium ulcerans]